MQLVLYTPPSASAINPIEQPPTDVTATIGQLLQTDGLGIVLYTDNDATANRNTSLAKNRV